MAREVLAPHERAALRDRVDHLVGERAFVERARALRCDRLHRVAEPRKPYDVAFLRRLAVEEIMPARAGIGRKLAALALPVPRHARCDGEAVLRVADRALQSAIEAEAAVRFEHRVPGIDRARHRHRVNGILEAREALLAKRLV